MGAADAILKKNFTILEVLLGSDLDWANGIVGLGNLVSSLFIFPSAQAGPLWLFWHLKKHVGGEKRLPGVPIP